MLAGNKSDRFEQREIPTSVGADYARQYGMRFLEASAKEADNVEHLFCEIGRELTQQARDNHVRSQFSSTSELSANCDDTTAVVANCCRF